MAEATREASGWDFLEPDEWAAETCLGWLSRDTFPDVGPAMTEAARLLREPVERIVLTPVLMREESEVEAKINGHEVPMWVECTSRAKSPMRYWRVNVNRALASSTPEDNDG